MLSLFFFSFSKFMAVAIKDKPIEIWNIKLKQLLKELTGLHHKPNYIVSKNLSFTPLEPKVILLCPRIERLFYCCPSVCLSVCTNLT